LPIGVRKALIGKKVSIIGAGIAGLSVGCCLQTNRYTQRRLDGLSSFFMCGQWVEPGCSVPIVALSGRNVAHMIYSKDEKQFVVSPM
jgi:phytoene dehydrogenase-like protein